MTIMTVLAAVGEEEPSKAAFYIAGGGLALWAVLLATVGLSRPDFPSSTGQYRATIGGSLVLVLACVVSVLLTS